jgi:rhamnosyltransferase subunit B
LHSRRAARRARLISVRVVLTSWGSHGDVYPYLAIALELKARGHDAVLAVPEYFRTLVEGEGIAYRPVGPHFDPDDRELIERIVDVWSGAEAIIRETLIPALDMTYAELEAAVAGADLLVTHPATLVATILARKRRLAWVSTVLSPGIFFSDHDPMVPPPIPWLVHVARLGPRWAHVFAWIARRMTMRWFLPVLALRERLGLPRGGHPMFDEAYSPLGTLALFSPVIGAAQVDWPANVRTTGFVFYNGSATLPRELEDFLAAGPAPIVFTLGSSAVWAAGTFYDESAKAMRLVGGRAVLLVGEDAANRPAQLPEGVICVASAPHQLLFPYASAIVHSGGIGTTAQALRAGKPTLVVPHANDQPDNAARVVRLGVARVLSARRYRAARVARELQVLLGDARYRERAESVAMPLRSADGAKAACDALERIYAAQSTAPDFSSALISAGE